MNRITVWQSPAQQSLTSGTWAGDRLDEHSTDHLLCYSPNSHCCSSGSAELYVRLWATEHPILGGSLRPTCAHLVLSRIVRSDGYCIIKGIE